MSQMSEPPRRRLFFALWPDRVLGDEIWDLTRDCVRESGGRPVTRENLHLTLAFLGNVDAATLPQLRAAAAELACSGFEFTLDEVSLWLRSRALVLQPTVFPGALTELVESIWDAMAPFSLSHGPGTFRPHVTLARKAGPAPGDAPGVALTWRAREFCLVSSITDPGGARYEPLARYHLYQASKMADRQ